MLYLAKLSEDWDSLQYKYFPWCIVNGSLFWQCVKKCVTILWYNISRLQYESASHEQSVVFRHQIKCSQSLNCKVLYHPLLSALNYMNSQERGAGCGWQKLSRCCHYCVTVLYLLCIRQYRQSDPTFSMLRGSSVHI